MSSEPLAGWRAWRAAQAAAVASVTSAAEAVATRENPYKSGLVATVASVAADNAVLEQTRARREALAAELAQASADAAEALATPDPDLAAERAVMVEHYAFEGGLSPYQPEEADRLRDGLLLGFRMHPAAPVMFGPELAPALDRQGRPSPANTDSAPALPRS